MKPNRIFIVRHGESVGNVDKSIYKDIPDYALRLSPKGVEQANRVGLDLLTMIPTHRGNKVQFYVSPFWRTRETYLNIARHFPINAINYYEDPRLREQEWGQDMVARTGYAVDREAARDAYGHFYYRFQDGESCADVYDRVSDFMGTMFRDFEKPDYPRNVVIVTHGMTMRLFLMRFFHASVEEFESWANPRNCGYFELELQPTGKYILKTPLRKHIVRHNYQFAINPNDNKYFKNKHKFSYEETK